MGKKDLTYYTFPEPPSTNRYWRVFRGRTVMSAEARYYKIKIGEIASAAGYSKIEGPVSISIRWYRSRKSGDLDNRLKVILDALQGHMYNDDSQIEELHAYRGDDKKNPRLEVSIEEIKR